MAGKGDGPRTLAEAHEHRAGWYPGRSASAEHWRAYYLRSAQLYERIAEIDPVHRHEARWWANQQREFAAKFPAEAPEK